MDVISIALILGGIIVADDILNDKLRLGAKLADLFSRLSPEPNSKADSKLESKKTKIRMN